MRFVAWSNGPWQDTQTNPLGRVSSGLRLDRLAHDPVRSVAEHSAGAPAGRASFGDYGLTRNPDMANPRGKLGRRVECRAVLDAFVEQHEVRGHPRPHQTPVAERKTLRRH